MAEYRMSAPTLGAAALRELRARPIYGNRIKVAAYKRRHWIRSEEGSEASQVTVSVTGIRKIVPSSVR